MKDISKRIAYVLLVAYLIAIITQIFFTLNHPAIITGKASTAQISVTILSKIPFFPLIPNQTVYIGGSFIYYINATDADDNNLTFSDNATFFNLTAYNGTSSIINFTATAAMEGTHYINISVADNDGNMYYQDVVFIITTAVAPPVTPPAGGGGGGAVAPALCAPAWVCTTWEPCTREGIQYRVCTDVRNCKTLEGKPPESRVCLYIPSCFDGLQNGHETDIDCGGQFCRPCEDGRKCSLDRDCLNLCNATTNICYSPAELPPPILVEPKPVSLWQRISLFIISAVRYLILKWMVTLPAIIILILFAYLSVLFETKKKLKLIYLKGDQSVWRYKAYVLKVFRILNRKKLRINLEIVRKRRHLYNEVNLSGIMSRLRYSLKSMARGLNPVLINMLLSELKRQLRRRI